MKKIRAKVIRGKVVVTSPKKFKKKEFVKLLQIRDEKELFYLLGGDWQLKHHSTQIKGYSVFLSQSSELQPIRLYNTLNFNKTVAAGRKFYKSLYPKLYKKICIEWNACENLKNFDDDYSLILAIAGLIKSISEPTTNSLLIAAILSKRGLEKFCKCSL
jgi:hypothetical protein